MHRVRAALYLVVVLAGLVEQIHARVQVVEQGLGAANLVSVNQVLLGVQRVVHGLARMVEQRGGYPLAMRAAGLLPHPVQPPGFLSGLRSLRRRAAKRGSVGRASLSGVRLLL